MLSLKPLLLVSAAAIGLNGAFAQVDTLLGPQSVTVLGPTLNNQYISETLVDIGVARLYVANVGQTNCKLLPTGTVGKDGSSPIFVEDIVMDRTNKVAFLGSDPFRLKSGATGGWMPGGGLLDAAYGATGNGAMFTYTYGKDTGVTGAGTTKLSINPPLASFHPHGFKTLAQSDGSTLLFVVNHRAQIPYNANGLYSVVEVLKYDPKVSTTVLQHVKTVQDQLIWTPNNVVPVSATSFYVSNDHENRDGLGRSVEEYLQEPKAWVTFCDWSSGTVKCIKAAEGLRSANGMNTDGSLIWVNEATGGDVVAFSRNANNTLTVAKRFNLDYVPDNLSYDPVSKTFTVTGHPQGLAFQTFSAGITKTAPSWVDIIRPADGTTKRIWSDNGDLLAGSTVFEVDSTANVALTSGVFQKAGIVRCQIPSTFSK